MHMISKRDLSDAELDTLTKSCSPTIVITANGEVQTHEEAIVYVKELDIFLTMKVLENTPVMCLTVTVLLLNTVSLIDQFQGFSRIHGKSLVSSRYDEFRGVEARLRRASFSC